MKIFLAFVRKEFWHVIRDKRSLLILLGLPVVMMLLFGFALSNEVRNSQVAVLDFSKDATTAKIIEKIEQSRYFTVTKSLKNEREIPDVFRKGQARLVVIFPPNFQRDLFHTNKAQVRLIGDASDANTASIVVNYAGAIMADYQNELFGERKLPYTIEVSTQNLYNPQLKSAFNFVPGVMTLILMLLGAMMTSVSIVKEKETGTMEVLLVSPMQPLLVVLSKAVPYLILCFADVLLILLMAYTVLEIPMRGHLPLLLAESLLFIITTLSLGLLISTIVASQQVAMFASLVGLLMPALVFSGFMFPLENMPLPLQLMSNVSPTKWYYLIIKSIMIKGLGFEYVWLPTLILTGMTVFFLAVAIKKFKVRLA